MPKIPKFDKISKFWRAWGTSKHKNFTQVIFSWNDSPWRGQTEYFQNSIKYGLPYCTLYSIVLMHLTNQDFNIHQLFANDYAKPF